MEPWRGSSRWQQRGAVGFLIRTLKRRPQISSRFADLVDGMVSASPVALGYSFSSWPASVARERLKTT
jgi:hypothetical protein